VAKTLPQGTLMLPRNQRTFKNDWASFIFWGGSSHGGLQRRRKGITKEKNLKVFLE